MAITRAVRTRNPIRATAGHRIIVSYSPTNPGAATYAARRRCLLYPAPPAAEPSRSWFPPSGGVTPLSAGAVTHALRRTGGGGSRPSWSHRQMTGAAGDAATGPAPVRTGPLVL